MTRLGITTVLLLALASAGCEDGRVRPPQVRVTIVHAAKTHGGLDFFRGATARGKDVENFAFRTAAQRDYEADEYGMHVNIAAGGNAIGTELTAFTAELTADNAYRIVIAESAGDLVPLVVENPAFPLDAGNAEITLVHAAETFGDVDVYVEPSGTALASATPLGTAAFGGDLAPATRDGGDYRLYLTAVGDPSTVLFRSTSFALEAGQSNLLVLTDGAGEGLFDVAAMRVNASSSSLLLDASLDAGVRFINAASDREARDVYVDDDFSTPLVGGLAFGATSDFELVAPGERDLNVTPAANPSVVEHTETESLGRGRLYTVLVADNSEGLTATTGFEDRRPLRSVARLQFLNGAGLFEDLEVYFLEPGTDVADATPIALGGAPSTSASIIVPGDYEITVTDGETEAVLAGPVAVTLDAGSFYSVLVLDGVGGSTVDLDLLDDFN